MRTAIAVLACMFLGTAALALKPEKVYLSHPDSLQLNSETHVVETPDGAKLKVWLLKPKDDIKNGNTLIISYGDAGNMSYWLTQCGILTERGFTVVMFDYRGFGESSDFSMNPNQLYYNEFATDLKSIIQWTKQHVKSNKLGVWSLSMGTIMSTWAVQTEKVDFMVGEGFVSSLTQVQKRLFDFKQREMVLPENSGGYEALIRKIEIPVLLFAGNQDQFTTVEDSKQVAAQKKNRRMIRFEGNHLQGFQVLSKHFYGDGYLMEIERFIKSI